MVKTPISSMTVPPPLQPYFDHQGQQFGFTGTEEPVQKPQEHSLTLLVRHLPEAIPQDTLSRLFSHYGASSIRPCVGGRMRNCAFVDFKDEVLASQSQSQLHRLKFLGKVLSVERAGRTMSNNKNQQSEGGKNSTCAPETGAPATSILAKGGIPSLLPINEPVASKLGVDYPFPPHLDMCPSALDAIFWSFEPSALLNCSSIVVGRHLYSALVRTHFVHVGCMWLSRSCKLKWATKNWSWPKSSQYARPSLNHQFGDF